MTEEVEQSRLRVEASLARLRQRVEGEIGWAPRLGIWVLPVAALAVGATIAWGWRRRRRPAAKGRRRTR